jgi:hypothetical protein
MNMEVHKLMQIFDFPLSNKLSISTEIQINQPQIPACGW